MRLRRGLIGAGVALVLVAVLSWWVVPTVVRNQIEQRASAALARTVSVAGVSFNPLNLGVEVRGLDVRQGDETWLRWERLYVNPRVWSLVRGRLGFDVIELDGFDGRVAVDEAGELNFADLLARESADEEDEEEAEPTVVEIGSLVVREARIEFLDASHARPFATTLGPVSFSLADFHTVGDPQAPYEFVATTEAGETLSWNGQLSATPLHSQGSIELGGIQLAKYAPYLSEFTAAEIRNGQLHVKTDYRVAVSDGGLELELRQGDVVIENLAVSAVGRAGELVSTERLHVRGMDLDWAEQRVAIDAVTWTGGRVELAKQAEGLELVQLLAGSTTEGATQGGDDWRVTVGELGVDGLAALWRDETLAQTATVEVAALSVQVRDLDLSDLTRAVPVTVAATLANGGGNLAAVGEAGLVPFRPALDVTVTDVDLAVASPYVQAARPGLHVGGGTLAVKGALGTSGDSLVFRGGLGVAGLSLTDDDGAMLAAWEQLHTEGVSLVLEPLTLDIERVRLVRPDVAMAIRRDGSINWMPDVPAESAEIVGPVVADSSNEAAPVIRVSLVELVEARVDYRDESLVTRAGAVLTELSGEMTGLSSVELGKGQAELRGRVNGSGSVLVQGDFNPLGQPAFTDLAVTVERMDLSPLSGYVGQYAGYALQRGRMTLAVNFKLQDRVIDSETVVTLDGFTLGAKVDSPDATSLPVPLALKLLRDGDGQIVIDLPVGGSLDDPEFRVGRVVWRVITNLLTKAATAPFKMLGGLVGGGGEAADDLDEQIFAAASAELAPAAIQKLDTLAAALQERPELALLVHGEYAPEADAVAWRPAVLEQRLRERAAEGQWSAADGWAENARMGQLVNLYMDVFGVPPLDPDTPVEMESVVEGEVAEAARPDPEPRAASDDSLMGWLRRVFGGGDAAADESSPESVTAVAGEEVDGGGPGAMPAMTVLPEAEIEARLLSAIEISEADLIELARARAQAVQAKLVAAGIAANRIELGEVRAGMARVSLELR
ncbi:DUF748 domain-containing protein [Actomonas aquatica]|uniref:DUF748 domain-containing protein n=1 Tax=Actomonas aquatica TaxID=2866162 RepID=A0ABZ1C6H3_9BACT|nr:DUF748 domain-containing protein [Opitutus sp. WL0086]WRQ86960.1 DUF748 domain-containing protein [Opitutus sp. WL0086]